MEIFFLEATESEVRVRISLRFDVLSEPERELQELAAAPADEGRGPS